MNRQSAALLVVAVALFAVIAAARLGGTSRVAGSAQAERLAGPPEVGACLLTEPPVGGGWGYDGPLYPALPMGACSQTRWGEVVAVMPAGLTASTSVDVTDASGSVAVANAVQTRCADAETAYLGAGTLTSSDWFWDLGATAAIGPTTRQRSAGQSWIACVVTPNTGSAPVGYRGSLQHVVLEGALPAAFATCAATVQDVLLEQAGQNGWFRPSCDRAHVVEIFGRNSHLADTGQSELERSCSQLIGSLTRMPDPTAGGLLAIRAISSHPDASTGTPVLGVGWNGASTCIVEATGHRQLEGTLVGLGIGAIPWA